MSEPAAPFGNLTGDALRRAFPSLSQKLDLRGQFGAIQDDLDTIEERLKFQVQEFDPGISGYISYALESSGKRIRPALVLLAAVALSSLAVPAVLELVDREMTRLRIPYGSAVAGLAAEFRSARRQGDDGAMAGIGPACLWLAFNHPQTGALMRERVSDALRREGKAHLTLTVAGERLCLALGPQFVDAVPLMEAMPADCVVVAPERAPCGTTH